MNYFTLESLLGTLLYPQTHFFFRLGLIRYCGHFRRFIRMNYPFVRRDATVEYIHGHKVEDPYRWLEDPDSDETKNFIDSQNALTMPYLEKCSVRDKLRTKLTQMWNYPKFSCPYRRGSRYFFFMNTGLQNQSVMYVQDSIDGEPRVFLDPNLLSDDGTVALTTSSFSEDGEIYAYGLSKSGSDWISIHFKVVETGEDYPEILEKVKFSGISWTHDNKGIFYSSYPQQEGKTDGSETTTNENQKLYYHMLRTQQKDDILTVEFPEQPKWAVEAEVTDCGKFLIVFPRMGCKDNLLYFCHVPDVLENELQLTCIIDKFEADYEYVTNEGSVCIFRTNKDAPNYRLIKIDLDDPLPEKWETLIPEHEKNVLDWAAAVDQDKLVIGYVVDVKSVVEIHSMENGTHLLTLPIDVGTVSGYSGKKKHKEIFYQFTSFLSPGIIYHLDFTQQPYVPKVFREIKIKGFNPKEFVAKQVFYRSVDGVSIPMFIIHSSDLTLNGSNPTLLYGYGGFNISIQPYFSISRIMYMQCLKGIVAVANIRGGGEYGEVWHNSGRLLNKQTCFSDFQAAAQYLVQERYTCNRKIVIHGGSNGGLLVGACINQRPDLFGAAVADVGVMDMLRFHKFTIGYLWCSDYGNPDEKEHFENVIKYSPLHNVTPQQDGHQYPSTFLLTADHDDRVVPLHSFKLIAELQYKVGVLPGQKNPLLIRIDTKAGHGGGKPTAKVIEEHVDIYSFVINSLEIDAEV